MGRSLVPTVQPLAYHRPGAPVHRPLQNGNRD